MSKLAIIGAGDLGQLIAFHMQNDIRYQIAGYIDDFAAGPVNGIPVIGKIDKAASLYESGTFESLIIAIGYKHLKFKKELMQRLQHQSIPLATFVHSSCIVAASAHIANGSCILPGCVIDHNVVVGANTLVNIGTVIAHDTSIGNNNFLGPGVRIAGFVQTESECFIGIGTIIKDNIKICSNTITGAGAVVVHDITEPGVYIGMPAKKITS